MFVALEVKGRGAGLSRAISRLFGNPGIRLEPGGYLGARYAVLQVEAGKRLDWSAIARIAGPYRDRLLMPEGMEPPPDCGLERPELPMFMSQVLAETACAIIARTKIPLYRRVLGLVDIEARHTGMLEQLLTHYTSIRVVTGRPEAYEPAAERMMRELGAPVQIGERLSGFEDCALILSPNRVYTTANPDFPCPVLAGDTFVSGGRADLITGLRVEPPDALKEVCPPGIRPHDFAGAIYEFCGIQASPFLADKMHYNYMMSGIDEVAQAVAHNAGVDSPRFKSR